MTTDFSADQELVSAFGPFYAFVPAVHTHHLLASMMKNEQVSRFLAPYEVTRVVMEQLLDDEETEPGRTELTVLDRWGDEDTIRFSDPMVAALRRAGERPSLTGSGDERSPVDLMVAILEDEDCLVTGKLALLGVDVPELLRSVRDGRPVAREDRVDPELRSTRDALIGRRTYRPVDLGQFWTSLFVRWFPMQTHPGRFPGLWARLEAGEVAQRHGGRVRSDDLLLAIARTHAVAQLYPHLTVPFDPADSSRAGQILSAAGLDHRALRAALDGTDLGEDAVPLKKQMRNHPVGTTELLRRLLADPGNRAVRLLESLGVAPETLREQIAVSSPEPRSPGTKLR